MNLKDFTEEQQLALLDLAMLGMYADGHLASAEDERVHRLLAGLGYTTDYDHARQYDAAVTRVSRHSQSADSARSYALSLAKCFTKLEQRQRVDDILNDLLFSDQRIAREESAYLAAVREALQL